MADKKVKARELLITNENFPFAVREAYNTLRTNVLYALSPINGKIVAVTSPNAGEGKSTVSVNLAIALAETSARVLLIDCDLRKPTIHKKLGLNNSSGLSKFIVGFETMADALTREILPNLDVMTSGPIPPNPSELLGSANMQTFLNKVSDYYDYIILDTPPINIVTDMAVMANFISGVLLVSYYASTTIEDVRRAQEALKIVNAKILGLVVAGVIRKKGNKGDYYRKSR
ncbi:MAG TPA: capsular biosynthesis protein [Clostridiales bacterium]|uniref:CpsD/CapB family tyrosine-protein kinase n=1 Tax=Candidatus Egerieisoma faecipullorum TaxID=2840963 RepID=A0A9D1I601_9CLOT|nr:capsular biosynthesis protein [Clostridiales bacterium]HIU28804.1 CpsD/CapB family tyrosine-protein kinase [Candidatus Egerieisoma faecipullorum]